MIYVRLQLRRPPELTSPGDVPIEFVQTYTECPWPRLPVKGDEFTFYAPDVFDEPAVEVVGVLFHPTSGDVLVKLETQDTWEGSSEHYDQLRADGFREGNTDAFFETAAPTHLSTSTSLRTFLKGASAYSERCTNMLARKQVTTLEQLLKMTEEDLLAVEGLGSASVRFIKRRLADADLALKDALWPPAP